MQLEANRYAAATAGFAPREPGGLGPTGMGGGRVH